MKAMILAAGKGTRVRPLTYKMPKPMLPIINKPVMELIVAQLQQHGVQDIMVNLSYMPDSIPSYFNDGHLHGVNIGYAFEGYKTADGGIVDQAVGSAGGIRDIQQHSTFFDQTFIVLCGDAVIDVDFTKALAEHKKNKALATIICQNVPLSEVHKYGVVETNAQGKIISFQEKPNAEEAKSTLINTGIYIFEPEIFNFIPAKSIEDVYDIGGQLFPKLVANNQAFFALEMDFQWVDIGTVEDFWTANQQALAEKINNFTMPGKQVKPQVWLAENVHIDMDLVDISGAVYIGSGCSIGKNVKLTGPLVLGRGCVIPDGVSVANCWLDNYTQVLATIEGICTFGEHVLQHQAASGKLQTLEAEQASLLVSDSRFNNF